MFFHSDTDTTYAGLFDYVDFGEAGNQFLRQCGTKDAPSPPEMARALCEMPQQVWGKPWRFFPLFLQLSFSFLLPYTLRNSDLMLPLICG